jgi:hypothetical protein
MEEDYIDMEEDKVDMEEDKIDMEENNIDMEENNSLMFNRRVGGADSEDSFLWSVFVVFCLFTRRCGLFLYV